MCVLLVVVYLIAGCGNDPRVTAPPPPAPGFLPLAVGSQWDYAVSRTQRIISKGDTSTTVVDGIEQRELVGVDSISGREYLIEQRRLFLADTLTSTLQVLLRQDDSGLFAAQGDTLPEVTLLLYPLEPGTQWLRNPLGLPVTLVVEDADTLDLVAGARTGFRIRVEVSSLGPDGFWRVWYGPCGFLRSELHQVLRAMDPLTGDIVILIFDDTTELVALHLVEPGQCATAP